MNVKELKINHILEKGFELFSKEGIDNVTMNNVAEKAKIGVASLYRYFSTKEELAIQCATKKWQSEKEKALHIFTSKDYKDKNGLNQLTGILDYFADSFDKTQDFYRFIYYFDSFIKRQSIKSENLENYEKIVAEITEIAYAAVKKGFSDGSIKVKDDFKKNPEGLTLTIMHGFFSLTQKLALSGEMLNQDIKTPPKYQIDLLKKLIIAALSN